METTVIKPGVAKAWPACHKRPLELFEWPSKLIKQDWFRFMFKFIFQPQRNQNNSNYTSYQQAEQNQW